MKLVSLEEVEALLSHVYPNKKKWGEKYDNAPLCTE